MRRIGGHLRCHVQRGRTVELIATPGSGEKAVWTSGCTSSAGNTCEVQIQDGADATVVVEFESAGEIPVSVEVEGEGKVSAGGSPAPITGEISECEDSAGECDAKYQGGDVVTLTSTPAAHQKLVWTVEHAEATTCTGSASPCTITVGSQAIVVKAVAQPITHTLGITLAGTGTGTVECKFGAGAFGSCSGPHNEGEAVEVKATPAPHSTFAGFSAGTGSAAACTTSPCSFTLEADSTLTATFTAITHTVAVTTAGTGTGTVECKFGPAAFGSCSGPHNEGEAVEVKATPAPHSTFAGFSAGTGSAAACTTSPCSFTLEADSTLTATFTAITHTVAVTTAGTGTGTVECKFGAAAFGSCSGPHNEGEAVEVKATPAPHSTFAGFSAGTGSAAACTTSPCSFTLEADSTLTATFNSIARTLGTTLAGTGTGSVECKVGAGSFGACASSYNDGTELALHGAAAPHSTFAGFSAGTGSAAGCSGASDCTFTIEADSTVTATFTAVTHTITVTSAGSGAGAVACKFGAGSFGSCSGPHNEGEAVEVKATAALHSSFDGFSAGTGSAAACTTSPCSFTLEADSTVTATFTKETATLEITKTGNGTGVVTCKVNTGSFGSCVGPFNKGDEITAKADAGEHSAFGGFSAGTGDAEACTTSPCTFTLEEASTLTATFTLITHSLTITGAGTGSGSVTCNGGPCASSYDEGTTVVLAGTASAGSTFDGFSGGGCSGTSCTLSMGADTAVTATFTANPTPPPTVKCHVPRLKNLPLGRAKRALRKAHCGIGRITKPHHRKGKRLGPLVVKSSRPGAGAVRPKGTKVSLRLGLKPKRHARHTKHHQRG